MKRGLQYKNLPNLNTPWPPFMLSSRAPSLTPMIRSGTSPTVREWVFSIPFPFPNFGNGIIHSRSRFRTPKCHSRSPLHLTTYIQNNLISPFNISFCRHTARNQEIWSFECWKIYCLERFRAPRQQLNPSTLFRYNVITLINQGGKGVSSGPKSILFIWGEG